MSYFYFKELIAINKEEKSYKFNEMLSEYLKKFIKDGMGLEVRIIEEGNKVRKGKSVRSIVAFNNCIYVGKEKEKVCCFSIENMSDIILQYSPWAGSDWDIGVFFVPNPIDFNSMETCTSKDRDVNYINVQYLDLDCTDEEIRKDELKLKKWKKEQYYKLLKHPVKPSIIIRTKHGLHCYWLINEGKKEKFRGIQMQLIQEFGGDPSCVNLSHCLRLPGFYHRKDLKNPYPVSIAHKDYNLRYTQEGLEKLLPSLTKETLKEIKKRQRETKPLGIDKSSQKKVFELIKSKIDYVKDYAKKITTHCVLPGHPDINPSAWIDKEYLWYHCGSSNCGVHMPLEELSEEMGWDDVLEELRKPQYEINLEEKYKEIKNCMVKVEDIEELKLDEEEEVIKNKIVAAIMAEFKKRGQQPNPKHKKYIEDIVTILLKGKPSNIPDLIPLDMGGGKSTIIEIFLSEMLKINPNYGTVVVVERIEDAKKLASKINERAETEVAYPVYGFEKDECSAGKMKCVKDKKIKTQDGRFFRTTKCDYFDVCRYAQQYEIKNNFPITIITHERLLINNKNTNLDNYYGYFIDKDGFKHPRTKIFIDEKPKLVSTFSCTKKYLKKFWDFFRLDSQEQELELERAMNQVEKCFELSTKKIRENIEPIDPDFVFSEQFWDEVLIKYDYKQDSYKTLLFIENLIRNGGHRDVNSKNVTVSTSVYNPTYSTINFHTVIFDGTADIDLSYKHNEYRVFNFEPIRTYENFTMYQCDFIKSSKKELKKTEVLIAFCNEVKRIAEDYPNSKIYVPVYQKQEEEIKGHLKSYIDSGRVMVDHFNGTRGKNDYLYCDIVVVGGILHKNEVFYIGLHRAKNQSFSDDINCHRSTKTKNRSFNNPEIELTKVADMVVDITQEIKRSKQRDNTRSVEGKLFIFTAEDELLKVLPYKFPGCKVEEWLPNQLVESKLMQKQNHKQAKNEKIIIDIFKGLTSDKSCLQEIIKMSGLNKSVVTRTIIKPLVQAVISELGYQKIKVGREVFFVRETS